MKKQGKEINQGILNWKSRGELFQYGAMGINFDQLGHPFLQAFKYKSDE